MTFALFLNGLIYSILSIIQYALLAAGEVYGGEEDSAIRLSISALGYVTGAVAMILQAPIYLMIGTMRQALYRAVRC